MLPDSRPFLIPMLEALVTRRREALRSCLQHCGSKQQLLHSYFRSTESTMSRSRCLFATSCSQLAAKKTRTVQKKSNSSPKPARVILPAIPPKTEIQSYTSFVDSLKLRQNPTLLYQSSSHLGYLIGCYMLGGFCFGYSVINFNTYYLHPPEGVWAPIPNFIGGVCLLMVGIGIFFCRRVSSIHGVNRVRY